MTEQDFHRKDDSMSAKPQKKENAMAGVRPMCNNLRKYYELSAKQKSKYLTAPDAKYLFKRLPKNVGEILRDSFLNGLRGKEVDAWPVVRDYFQNNSEIIPALTKNPGTYAMLEKMYHFEKVFGVIDNYFLQSTAGGQALRNRYDIVTDKACEHVEEVLVKQKKCLVLDIGSGPGRNCIDMCRKNPDLIDKTKIHCIDIDDEAIIFGKSLAKIHGVKHLKFIKESMTKLRDTYKKTVDYGLLIGILCGLTYREKVMLLNRIKPCFKPGAKLVSAALTVEMAKKDLLCAYILRETTGWSLQYPDYGELKTAYKEAGWSFDGCFQEASTKLYEIVIGRA